jgi:hypothetical protein
MKLALSNLKVERIGKVSSNKEMGGETAANLSSTGLEIQLAELSNTKQTLCRKANLLLGL